MLSAISLLLGLVWTERHADIGSHRRVNASLPASLRYLHTLGALSARKAHYPQHLAWMWQSGSEGRGVATDKVALQKRREDGSTYISHCIFSKTLHFQATNLRSVVS